MQEETLNRMFLNLENNGLKVRRFRADSRSYTQMVLTCALEHAEFIYFRAQNFGSLYEKVKSCPDWKTVEINNEIYEVRSLPFDAFEGVEHCRLEVQRQKKKKQRAIGCVRWRIFIPVYSYQ